MLVDIDKIKVVDRIRKDFGDIQELAEDIKKNGLINPPTINKEYRLLAGERRLRACKLLGWTQIEVHMLDTKNEAHDLDVELSENNMRRNFTGSELAEGIRRQMAIEQEKAKERQAATQFGSDGGANIGTTAGKSRDAAGEAFGISGEQARKTLFVDEHCDLLDPVDFADWDEGKLSTNKAFQRIKAAQERAIKERDLAKRVNETLKQERDKAKSELRKASVTQTNLEMEAQSLRQQLAEKPEPEIIEREVPPADYEDVKRRNESLKHDNARLSREYQEMWEKKRELDKRLEQANELLGEKDRNDNAKRDIEQLTIATNNYLRQYGGKAWAFDQFYRVDETTQAEFKKAIANIAAFSQNLLQMIGDMEAKHE